MSERVYVILPVFNRRETTRQFIDCLRAQTYENYHLILIDDGSSDGTADMVLRAMPGSTVLTGKGRWWWGGSLQRAYDWLLKSDREDNSIVLIANDDTTFTPEFLDCGVAVLRNNPRSLLLSRIKDNITGKVVESGVHADLRRLSFEIVQDGESINCLSTKGLFLRWSDMKNIGGFYPFLLPHYWSDYEYSIRAHRKRYLCITDESVALSADTSTTGNRRIDQLTGWTFIKTLFSPRTIANPLYKTSFVLLAVPFRWKFVNLIRIWRDAMRELISRALAASKSLTRRRG